MAVRRRSTGGLRGGCTLEVMGADTVLSVRLEPWEADRLEAEAGRLGVDPSALAHAYVRAGIAGPDGTVERALVAEMAGRKSVKGSNRQALHALDRLVAATAGLPPVDGISIAKASRRALERRALS
jgi:hypothetical protein